MQIIKIPFYTYYFYSKAQSILDWAFFSKLNKLNGNNRKIKTFFPHLIHPLAFYFNVPHLVDSVGSNPNDMNSPHSFASIRFLRRPQPQAKQIRLP
jgi:hypothetical protein